MNNEIKMKVITSNGINMKLEDNKPINVDMYSGIKEVDPIFRDSAAYTITFDDIYYWNHKSNFSGNYNDLVNKPIIPTTTNQLINNSGFITKDVSNLTNYTLSSNLANVATTGLYSDLLEKPTIPTDTSDLTNNAGFVTASVNDLENYTLSSNLSDVATTGNYSDLLNTPSLANVATTGLYDDLLNKPTLSTVASTGDYSDLTNKPTIPTKTSELNNDSGFITNTVNNLTNYTLSSSLATVATSGSYADLSNKPNIPTKTSELTNDSGYVTNTYTTTETRCGTWINGKPLYRQVIETTTPSSLNSSVIGSITNLGVMVNLYGFLTYNTQQVPLMLSYSTTVLNALLVDGTNITCKLSANAYTSCSCFVVCEYTKSTD